MRQPTGYRTDNRITVVKNNQEKTLETTFWGSKYLNSFMQIRKLFDPESGMEKFGSGINIPDRQHHDVKTSPT
jgi:hypothetical protein